MPDFGWTRHRAIGFVNPNILMGFLSSNYRPNWTIGAVSGRTNAGRQYCYSPWRTLLFILNVFCEYRVPCRVRHAPKRAMCLWPVLPCRYPFDMQAASLRPLILSIELLRIVFIRLTARNTLLRVTWQSLL